MYLLTLGACFCFVGLITKIYVRQKRKMSFRKGMLFLQVMLFLYLVKRSRDVMQAFPSVSVNIIILVLAVALFLLVLHHNFLGLSSLLKNEVSGMGTLTNALASVEDLEFPMSHILSYITRLKEKKAFFWALQKLLNTLGEAWWYSLCSCNPCPPFSLLCTCLLRV